MTRENKMGKVDFPELLFKNSFQDFSQRIQSLRNNFNTVETTAGLEKG
jgi:hypothetical protein